MLIRHDQIACYVARPDAAGVSHEFLQLRRAALDYMGGTWATVAGGIEAGEAAWETALRELREEAGLTPVEFFRLGFVNSFYIPSDSPEKETLWHQVPFLAIVRAGDEVVLNEEHDAWRWIARREIDALFMWPTDRAALAHACRDILDGGLAKEHLRMQIPRR